MEWRNAKKKINAAYPMASPARACAFSAEDGIVMISLWKSPIVVAVHDYRDAEKLIVSLKRAFDPPVETAKCLYCFQIKSLSEMWNYYGRPDTEGWIGKCFDCQK